MANLVTEAVQENTYTCQVNSSFSAMPIIKTVEGISIAYGSLVLMSLLSIVIGAFRSVSYLQMQKELGKNLDGNWNYFMILLTLHIAVRSTQVSSIKHICWNLLYTGCLFLHAMAAMTPLLSHMTASAVLKRRLIYNFTYQGVLCRTISTGIFVWYLLSKHWIAHDLIGFALVVRGIEVLQWANFVTGYGIFGCISIVGLWIGPHDLPSAFTSSSSTLFMRLAFPIDLFENGLDANNFATFGYDSILIPGVFLALVLRFDGSLNRGTNFYFNRTLAAYLFGLATSFLMKHLYDFYYPALLLSACLGIPIFLAVVRGDIKAMFRYDDFPSALPADEMPDDEMPDDEMPDEMRLLLRLMRVLH